MSRNSDNQKKICIRSMMDEADRVGETSQNSDGVQSNPSHRKDTADYVEKITADLCIMAMRSDMHFLAYLLDMARMEAFDRSNDREIEGKKTVI